MANKTYHRAFGELPSILYTSLSNHLTSEFGELNDSVLLLLDDHHHSHYSIFEYHDTTTILIMIVAWLLLILGLTLCCCSQCIHRTLGGLNGPISNELTDNNSSNSNSSSITIPEYDQNRSDATDPVETCRNYPPNYEMESLPSYTIVSGLPTYDDALEQFRKAGIILAPPMPIIKIFEAKDTRKMYSIENGVNENDNLSITNSNACTCTNSAPVTPPPALPSSSSNAPLIELSPEQLAQLSQKRLSLQIAFGSQMHRNSRPRINMHNQLLLSRAISNADALEQGPQIHRSYSSSSFSTANNSN